MKNKENKLLHKYLNDDINDQENLALLVLEKKKIYDKKDEVFKNHLHESKLKMDIFSGINAKRVKKMSLYRALQIAATVVIMLGIGLGYIINSAYFGTTELSNNLKNPQSYNLPDGTEITLASGSSIFYDADFDDEFRKVELKGEAFFDVERDENRPFIIKTDRLNTEVLGTSFNIKQTDKAVKVTVVTGLVKVYDNKNEVKVKPQHEAVYNINSSDLVKHQIDNDYATSWLKDKYRLNRVDIIQLTDFVEQRFGVSLLYKDKEIEHTLITTTVRKGESIDDFIEKINDLEEINITKLNANELNVTLVEN
ncbi:MAG: FecR family protein [Bacteroidota bacterium]